jgi:hypothetical protein
MAVALVVALAVVVALGLVLSAVGLMVAMFAVLQ